MPRCRFAGDAMRETWPWTYCRTCRYGPTSTETKVIEPYFAPHLKKADQWDCATLKPTAIEERAS